LSLIKDEVFLKYDNKQIHKALQDLTVENLLAFVQSSSNFTIADEFDSVSFLEKKRLLKKNSKLGRKRDDQRELSMK